MSFSVEVRYDASVWLMSPSSDEDVEAWVERSTAGLRKAYRIRDKAMLAWVRRFLWAFAAGPGAGPNRFLRPARFVGPPVMAQVLVLEGLPPGVAEAQADEWDADVAWFDESTLTVVDEASGLRRYHRTMVDRASGSPLVQVHYHRGVPGCDVMIRSLNLDPTSLATAIEDLDTLAASVHIESAG